MAAGHFTTIPCEPNTVNRKLESHFFSGIGPHTNNIVCAKFSTFFKLFNFFCDRQIMGKWQIMGKCTIRHVFLRTVFIRLSS